MVSHCPAKFSDHGHCGNGDIVVLVVEEEDSRSFHQCAIAVQSAISLKNMT